MCRGHLAAAVMVIWPLVMVVWPLAPIGVFARPRRAPFFAHG
jgi:hypothetical protein